MARDYSSRRNGSAGTRSRTTRRSKPAATRRKPAARSGTRRFGAIGCVVWLLSAALLGVAGGAFYYIASRPSGHGPESVRVQLPNNGAAPSQNASGNTAGKGSGGARKKTQPRYSFYKMLPNYKVEVPADNQAGPANPASPNATSPSAAHASKTPSRTASTGRGEAQQQTSAGQTSQAVGANTNSETQNGGGYVIQAGAFSTHADADHRKARLALLGISSDISAIKTSDGKTIYRVQSDPVDSASRARTLAARLKSHGIDTMVRKKD